MRANLGPDRHAGSLTGAQRALLQEIAVYDDCEVVLNFRHGQQCNPGRSAYRMGWSSGRRIQSRTVEALESRALVALDANASDTRGVRITPAGRAILSGNDAGRLVGERDDG